MEQPLRILIVDDSAMTRRVLREMIASDPAISVVGEAADGREALARVAELRPDLVMLDVQMPVMDGVETTRQIMAYTPTPILVLTASLSSYNVDITFQMLGAGALDVMEKPRLNGAAQIDEARRALIRKIKLLARVRVVTHLRGRRKSPEPAKPLPRPEQRPGPAAPVRQPPARLAPPAARPAPAQVVVIGASTGGPRVVRQILSGLPPDFPAALLVVQHIAQGFSGGMAEWLDEVTDLPVRVATESAPIEPGNVLVAPDRFDLLVRHDRRVHLSDQPVLLQRPAIDITMQSVAEVYGPAAIGILLTGMGRDGAIGLQTIRRAGGYTMAQDEASCTIYGMPRAAVELGAATAVLPPDQIVKSLIERLAVKPQGAQRAGSP